MPVVPVYIQEKIHPQALIEDLRAQTAGARNEPQAELFADFNGIDFEHYIEFYQHGQSWTNRMILGDSLLVMASLAEKEALKGKVQMIYMDPPYGIKFGSNAERKVTKSSKDRAQASAKAHHRTICREKLPFVSPVARTVNRHRWVSRID